MRSILALSLLITLCASANAATVRHVHRHAEIMYDHDGPGLCRDGACNRRDVDIAGNLLGIHENRLRSGQFDRMSRRHVGLRRHDHFISGAQPKREPDEMHSGRAR